MGEPALGDQRLESSSWRWGALFLVASLVLHAAGLLYLSTRPESRYELNKPLELVMVEVAPPPPPPPEPPKPEVKPPPKPPIKVAATKKPPPPPPPTDEPPPPPPPNDTPPPPTEEPVKPVLVVGLSMSSTSSAGGFAAPVGNTLYGKTEDKATDPAEVKTYSAPRYVPVYQVDTAPSVASEVKIPYPEEARRAGVEGTVTLSITVDASGKVVKAKVLSGPGYGLDEAALVAIQKFKFKPAIKDGEPVSTEMKYAYTFLLD